MTTYTTYNKLYEKGKPVGRKYKVMSGKSRAEVTKKTKAYNTRWNKGEAKRSKKYGSVRVVAKLVQVKANTTKKKRRASSGYGNLFGW